MNSLQQPHEVRLRGAFADYRLSIEPWLRRAEDTSLGAVEASRGSRGFSELLLRL